MCTQTKFTQYYEQPSIVMLCVVHCCSHTVCSRINRFPSRFVTHESRSRDGRPFYYSPHILHTYMLRARMLMLVFRHASRTCEECKLYQLSKHLFTTLVYSLRAHCTLAVCVSSSVKAYCWCISRYGKHSR